MKYIAYGSNMSVTQMARRCPSARLLGVGALKSARLEFYLHATVEPDVGGSVPVAVWEIGPRDELRLDWYEGYPDYYEKSTATVDMGDGSQIEGMIYIMRDKHRMPPQKSYYDGIVDAYRMLGLSSEISRVLEPALRRSAELLNGA